MSLEGSAVPLAAQLTLVDMGSLSPLSSAGLANASGLFDVVHRGGVQSAFGPTQQHSILDTEMCVDSGVPYVSAAGQPSEPQSPEPQSHLGLFESPFEPLACLKLSLLSCSRFLLSFLKSVCPVRRIPRFVGPTAIRPSLGGDRRLTR